MSLPTSDMISIISSSAVNLIISNPEINYYSNVVHSGFVISTNRVLPSQSELSQAPDTSVIALTRLFPVNIHSPNC